jgi:hypothetical protein
MNPEEEVYLANLSIDNPVVGAFTMRQPLEELAAFTPVNSTPIHQSTNHPIQDLTTAQG